MIYRYLDGSGNEYVLRKEINFVLEYTPVKPLYSSSGTYDGGDYLKKEITELLYDKIISTINTAIGNKNILIKNRVKASGMIIIQEKNKEKVFILEPGSKEIKKIERILHGIISN